MKPAPDGNMPSPDSDEGRSGAFGSSGILLAMAKHPSVQVVLDHLEEALIQRNVSRGFSLLDAHSNLLEQLDPETPEALRFLLLRAQWADLGHGDVRLVANSHARFTRLEIARITFLDFLKLRLAEAFIFLSMENLDECISSLDLILRAGSDVLCPHLRFVAHFWKARAHRKKGEYENSLLHIVAARTTAENIGATKLVAVVKIHESWLIFQKGERRRALQLLDEAEKELQPTGHALSLGNIESARGRFVRRSGEYVAALTHFERAIAIYSSTFSHHPNYARALVNAAYVKRLMALDMQTKMHKGSAKGAVHSRYQRIIKEAIELLERAGTIYALHRHQSGTGSVLVNAGHLHLERGDIDRAAKEAENAYALGCEKNDPILMARSRILHAAVELARADEEMEEHSGPAQHADLAVRHADDAIEIATHTQNKRLLAEAYILRGTAAAADSFQDWELAKSYVTKASKLLSPDDRDHLLKELGALKSKILHSANIDQTLRQWSEGEIGNKTFQQIQEEFAEIVIPKVWLSQGKNITRVAQVLSISPKKVRRILRRAPPPGD